MGDNTTETQSMECPCCEGRGAIAVDRGRRCDIRDCNELAVWDYHNSISGAKHDYCHEHMANLRRDVHLQEWVEAGFAERIRPKA